MSLTETLPVARLALGNSTQRASWVTATARAAFRVAGAQAPVPRFTTIAAWTLHVSPTCTRSLRKGGIVRGQTSRMTRASFAVGEVIGTRHTYITTQSGHAGPAATLPRGRLTSRMQGTVGGAVAGDAVREAVETRAALLASGACVARTAAA